MPEETRLQRRARLARFRAARDRRIVLMRYARDPSRPDCSCCRLADFDCLTIDHEGARYGHGNRHREAVARGRGGHEFYRWLIRSGLPDCYRVLCRRCNLLWRPWFDKCPCDGHSEPASTDRARDQVRAWLIEQRRTTGAWRAVTGHPITAEMRAQVGE